MLWERKTSGRGTNFNRIHKKRGVQGCGGYILTDIGRGKEDLGGRMPPSKI